MARETIRVRVDGADVIRRLKLLGEEAAKNGGPVRAAVRKGAKVIAEEMKANVRKIVAEPNVGGGNYSTGLLEKSIKPMRAKANKRGLKGETFVVTVARRARYPVDKRTPSGVGVALVGMMLEYGTPQRQAMPWARPAYHTKKEEAAQVMADDVLKGVEKLERKLSTR